MNVHMDKIREFVENIKENKEPASELRASSAGYCLRKLDYDHQDGAGPIDFEQWLRFEIGHKIHDIFQDLFKQVFPASFGMVEDEVEIETPGGNVITGHIDGFLTDLNGVVEIKSCSDSVFKLIEGMDGPLNEHRKQANLYCHALEAQGVLYVYVNKNNSKVRCFWDAYDFMLAQSTIDFFDVAHENRNLGRISDRPYSDKTSNPCYWCAHQDKCYEDFEEQIGNLKDEYHTQDAGIYEITEKYNDKRIRRLELEKDESRLMNKLIVFAEREAEAKDITVTGKRKFRIKLKPSPKGKILGRVTEVKK